ncbi:MAG: SgcJ/EcaC family oxidoreductase [Sphingomicrobium sp.]
MKKSMQIPAGLALALSLAACDRAAAPADGNTVATAQAPAADAEAVKQAFASFNAAIVAKDLDTIRVQYADDAVMVIPDQAVFKGIDAIMGDYKAYAADPAGKYAPGDETTYVSTGGDLAYGQVNYQSTFTNSKTKAVEVADRYNLVIYRKQADGSWKVTHDVNSPLPKAG